MRKPERCNIRLQNSEVICVAVTERLQKRWAGPKKKKTGNTEVDKDDDTNKQPVSAK